MKRLITVLWTFVFTTLATACSHQGSVRKPQSEEERTEKKLIFTTLWIVIVTGFAIINRLRRRAKPISNHKLWPVFAQQVCDSAVNGNQKKLLTEGEDTRCEVVYKPYIGKNKDMFLNEGDKIAVISPSSLPGREQTEAVMNGLKDWGYEPVEGKHVCVESCSLEDVLEDLEWALEDPEIKAIFCVRGGYGASEIADVLPLEMIRNTRKLIIGYSDITVYHSAWITNGVPSIHSCMSATFSDFPESCFEAEEKILKGEIPDYTCESNSYCQQGEATGTLIGGNLSTFTAVIGSAYDCTKTEEPYILFLEDVGEDIQHIHRYLTILKHAGVLDKASGIVFGEWTELPSDMADYSGSSRGGSYKSVADMIARQFINDIDIPVAFGFPAGHGDINYPLLMGETARIRVDHDHFTFALGVDQVR